MANIAFYYGKKSELPQQGSEEGRLLFTVLTDEGQPEGHIYYDNGTDLIELYKGDLTALGEKIGDKSVADQIKAIYENSKTIEKDVETSVLEVKISKAEGNILKAVEDGLEVLPGDGIDYSIDIQSSGGDVPGTAKKYTITQKTKTSPEKAQQWTIDIPADMVVSDAKLKEISDYSSDLYPEDEYPGVDSNGTYLHLIIANATKKDIYVNLSKFADVYKGADEAQQVKVTVEGYTISASIVASSITDTELADNAVTENKINNGAVTSDKLASDAVASAAIQNGAVTEDKLAQGVKDQLGGLTWKEFAVV